MKTVRLTTAQAIVKRGLLGDGLDHLETVVVAVDERPTRSGTILETAHSLTGEPGPPPAHRVGIDRQPFSDLAVGEPFCCQQHDPGPLHHPLLSSPCPQSGLQLSALLGV